MRHAKTGQELYFSSRSCSLLYLFYSQKEDVEQSTQKKWHVFCPLRWTRNSSDVRLGVSADPLHRGKDGCRAEVSVERTAYRGLRPFATLFLWSKTFGMFGSLLDPESQNALCKIQSETFALQVCRAQKILKQDLPPVLSHCLVLPASRPIIVQKKMSLDGVAHGNIDRSLWF